MDIINGFNLYPSKYTGDLNYSMIIPEDYLSCKYYLISNGLSNLEYYDKDIGDPVYIRLDESRIMKVSHEFKGTWIFKHVFSDYNIRNIHYLIKLNEIEESINKYKLLRRQS